MTRRSLFSQSTWNVASWLCVTAATLAVTALVFRTCGEADYGLWAIVLACRGFMMILDGGLTMGVSRDAALLPTEKNNAWSRIRAAWRLYAALALLALTAGALGAGLPALLLDLRGPAANAAWLVTLATAAEAALALAGSPLLGILRGRQRFDALAVFQGLLALSSIAGVALLLGPYGLPAAAFALLGARFVVQAALYLWMRLHGFLERPEADRPATPALSATAAFALPLWIAALGTWCGLSADVIIVGSYFNDHLAGHASLGARLASACAGLLFAVLGAAFPRFVVARAELRGHQCAAVLFLGATLAATGFGLLILLGGPLLTLWVGTAPPLALTVLTLYALVWTLNAPSHVLASLAIATGQHRVLRTITLFTVPANLALSLWLAARGLAYGPAAATLAVIAVSNGFVLPALLLRRLGMSWRAFLRPTLAGYLVGALSCGTAALIQQLLPERPLLQIAIVALTGLALAGAVLDLTVRNRSTLRRLAVRAARGGFRVLWRQHRECRALSTALARDRAPAIFTPTTPPLVTVRIATYNRGPLVAERAIASALAQTHDNLEIVVVGDCCDEATERAVHAVDDPRVRFENLPERGRYPDDPELCWMVAGEAPMNRALVLARGDWLAPLDDDDEFAPHHVEALLDACLSRKLDFAWGRAEHELLDGSWETRGSPALSRGTICHSAVLYSRRLFSLRHDIESWKLDDPGDWNLWSRFRRAGARMGFVDNVVTRHYRERREIVERRPPWLAAELQIAEPVKSPATNPPVAP